MGLKFVRFEALWGLRAWEYQLSQHGSMPLTHANQNPLHRTTCNTTGDEERIRQLLYLHSFQGAQLPREQSLQHCSLPFHMSNEIPYFIAINIFPKLYFYYLRFYRLPNKVLKENAQTVSIKVLCVPPPDDIKISKIRQQFNVHIRYYGSTCLLGCLRPMQL